MRLKLTLDSKSDDIKVGLYTKPDGHPTESYTVNAKAYETSISQHSVRLSNSILPAAVRYMDLSRGLVLFERPPCYMPVHFSNIPQGGLMAGDPSAFVFTLPLPWQRYVFFFAPNGLPTKVWLFFAQNQITSLDKDPMSFAPLPNLYEDSSVCLPVFDHVDVEEFDLLSAISNAYNVIWKSGFNMDIIKGYQHWLAGVSHNHNPIAKIRVSNGLDQFYRRWATFPLEKVVKFSWLAPAFDSFETLIGNQPSFSRDVHESVVDLFLAARAV